MRRALGDATLWDVARRAADHLVDTFGAGGNPDLDGHPVAEMALVELFRESGDERYLDLAEHLVGSRGHGTVRGYGRGPVYFSDRVPVRDAQSPEGHAVRAVYLAAGAADVAAEGRDDGGLDAALERQWRAMVEAKQYVTGGLGSRWDGEAFGDPYELPPDVAYAETCASIGAVQWAWRRLLATGEAHYADGIERLLLNGVLSGVSLSAARSSSTSTPCRYATGRCRTTTGTRSTAGSRGSRWRAARPTSCARSPSSAGTSPRPTTRASRSTSTPHPP